MLYYAGRACLKYPSHFKQAGALQVAGYPSRWLICRIIAVKSADITYETANDAMILSSLSMLICTTSFLRVSIAEVALHFSQGVHDSLIRQ